MPFQQNSISKKFVEEVKSLVQTGKVGTEKELAVKLDYNYTGLNQIINGKRNAPAHLINKFTEIYKPVEIEDRTVIEIALRTQAMGRVTLRAMAELLSVARNEAMTKTLGDLEAAVRAEIQLMSGR